MTKLTVNMTKDLEKIANIINMPDNKKWLIENNCDISKESLKNDKIKYYLLQKDDKDAGFCAFLDAGDGIIVGDVAILEDYRGKIGKWLSIMAIKAFLKNNNCKSIITRINKENKRALVFTKWLGFVKFREDQQYIYLGV